MSLKFWWIGLHNQVAALPDHWGMPKPARQITGLIIHPVMTNQILRAISCSKGPRNLLLVLLLSLVALVGGSGLLAPDAAGAASTEGRGQGEVDVLLRVETDNERGDVDDLLADAAKALVQTLFSNLSRGMLTGCGAGG